MKKIFATDEDYRIALRRKVSSNVRERAHVVSDPAYVVVGERAYVARMENGAFVEMRVWVDDRQAIAVAKERVGEKRNG